MNVEYKPNFQYPSHALLALNAIKCKTIDISFIDKNFDEIDFNYKDLSGDRITQNKEDILNCFESIFDENDYSKMISIIKISAFFKNDPCQTLSLMSPEFLYHFIHYVDQPGIEKYILQSLCYIAQFIEGSYDYQQVLIDPSFNLFEKISNMFSNIYEVETLSLIFFFLIYSLKLGIHIKHAILQSGIIEEAKNVIEKNNLSDCGINIYRARFFSEVALHEYDEHEEDQNNISITYSIYSNLVQYFMSMSVNENIVNKARNYFFKGLLSIFKRFPLEATQMANGSYFYRLTEFLSDKDPSFRLYSIRLIKKCIKVETFPIQEIYKYNTISAMLNTLQWDDKILIFKCLSAIHLLIKRPEPNVIDWLILATNSNLLSNDNSLSPLSFNIKYSLIINYFFPFAQKANSDQIMKLFSLKLILFLVDFLNAGSPSEIIYILEIFQTIFTKTNPQFHNSFKEALVQALNDSGSIENLITTAHDENTLPEQSAYIITFLHEIEGEQ